MNTYNSKFDELVNSILNEGIGDPDSARHFSGTGGRAQTPSFNPGTSSVQRQDRNYGLEREDEAKRIVWLVYDKDGRPVRGKEGTTFGARGLWKAKELAKKLDKTGNRGLHVRTKKGYQTENEFLFGSR